MRTKLLAAALALGLLSSGSAAYAGVDVQLNLGGPPVYAAPVYVAPTPPPPVYVQPYGYGYINHPWVRGWDPHHRASDYRYWHDHGHDHEHDHYR